MTEKKAQSDDERLLQRCEEVLAEINRNAGLIDQHLEVLAAVRIRLYGSAGKTLDEVLKAAGDLEGKASLEELEEPKPSGSLDDLLKSPPRKTDWPEP